MTAQDPTQEQHTHSAEIRQVHERLLAGTAVRSRFVEVGAGQRVHILENGTGPPVVLLHGTGGSGLFLLPLLKNLNGVKAIAADRPGQGMSDPTVLPRDRYRETAVAWVDRLLDLLELDSAAVAGHSMGGLWALWYALAHPDRVIRLVVIGAPALPKTRCPLPYRLVATPGLGELLQRLPPSPKSVLQFARYMGEQQSLADHTDLVDLQVASGRDPVAAAVGATEARVIVSPFALLSRSGFRRRSRVRTAELRMLAMPTLVMWGAHDPVGSVAVARAVTELIPDARLETLPGGHAPWLGHPEQTGSIITDFVREEHT